MSAIFSVGYDDYIVWTDRRKPKRDDMKAPSRRMPPLDDQVAGRFGAVVVWILFFGFLAAPGLIWWPFALVLPAMAAISMAIDGLRERSIAKLRENETIGDFARSFNFREVDTWIIRGVFEEFSSSYPIRSTDRFEEDLRIDQGDLEYRIECIASRINRSLDNAENNPFYQKILTIQDLVMFFQSQPLLTNNRHSIDRS